MCKVIPASHQLSYQDCVEDCLALSISCRSGIQCTQKLRYDLQRTKSNQRLSFFKTFKRSECSSLCFTYCQDICHSNASLRGSFDVSFPRSSSTVTCVTVVNQTLTCDLMYCVWPFAIFRALNIEYQSMLPSLNKYTYPPRP